MMRPETKT